MLNADMGVLLSRREAFVTEQFLDAAEVRAAFKQVRRKAVPERVRRNATRCGQLQPQSSDEPLNIAGIEANSPNTNKNRNYAVVIHGRFALLVFFVDVLQQRSGRITAERNDPLFSPLS